MGKKNGGVQGMQQLSDEKSQLIYNIVDKSDFYKIPVQKKWRSRVNIPIRIQDEKLESLFIHEASQRGMVELAGHRSVGGIRVSLYNAISVKETEILANFMKEFEEKNRL